MTNIKTGKFFKSIMLGIGVFAVSCIGATDQAYAWACGDQRTGHPDIGYLECDYTYGSGTKLDCQVAFDRENAKSRYDVDIRVRPKSGSLKFIDQEWYGRGDVYRQSYHASGAEPFTARFRITDRYDGRLAYDSGNMNCK